MELKDYLHLYIGCKAEFKYKQHFVDAANNGNESINKDVVDKMFEETRIQVLDKMNYFLWNPDYIKLILRPLSDMTEFERKEYQATMKTARATPVHQIMVTSLTAESFKYLLDKEFDIFELIPNGLAIDSTKI